MLKECWYSHFESTNSSLRLLATVMVYESPQCMSQESPKKFQVLSILKLLISRVTLMSNRCSLGNDECTVQRFCLKSPSTRWLKLWNENTMEFATHERVSTKEEKDMILISVFTAAATRKLGPAASQNIENAVTSNIIHSCLCDGLRGGDTEDSARWNTFQLAIPLNIFVSISCSAGFAVVDHEGSVVTAAPFMILLMSCCFAVSLQQSWEAQ